jgi:hypothetical protein
MERELKRDLLVGPGTVVPRDGSLVCLEVEEVDRALQFGVVVLRPALVLPPSMTSWK